MATERSPASLAASTRVPADGLVRLSMPRVVVDHPQTDAPIASRRHATIRPHAEVYFPEIDHIGDPPDVDATGALPDG
jgi:hypothetical protein